MASNNQDQGISPITLLIYELIDLYTRFSKNAEVMFPLDRILFTIENLNSSHPPYEKLFKQVIDALENNSLHHPNRDDTQFWAGFFFVDTIGLPFRVVLNAYAKAYDYLIRQKPDHDIILLKYHIGNCMLLLIEYWMSKAESQVKEVPTLETYTKKEEKNLFYAEILDARDEIDDIMRAIKVIIKDFLSNFLAGN